MKGLFPFFSGNIFLFRHVAAESKMGFAFGGLPRGLFGFCSSTRSLAFGGLPLGLLGFSSDSSLFFGGRPRGRSEDLEVSVSSEFSD